MGLRKSKDRIALESALDAAGEGGVSLAELVAATGLAGARVTGIMREVIRGGLAAREGQKAAYRYKLITPLKKTATSAARQAKGPKLMAVDKDRAGRLYRAPFKPANVTVQALASAPYEPLVGYRLDGGPRPEGHDHRLHGSREGDSIKPFTGKLIAALPGGHQ